VVTELVIQFTMDGMKKYESEERMVPDVIYHSQNPTELYKF